MGKKARLVTREKDGLWYKDAIIYELHVRSFADSTGDGVGDFRGLTGKLDYLQNLGVTAIWLLPFYPSPLRDDGYDIADYYSINPIYGTMADFKHFLKEAHERGLRVITELVINHTSDQHPWFQRARRAKPGSAFRDYYVWSDTPEKYKSARIIFRDFEPSNWSWDPVAKAYFWHRFYAHQPDLNFDNKEVRQEVTKILDYWLDMGVDGLRLDAIPYLYEREGTSCENLPETHAYLKTLRKHVDDKYGDRMLLAEANQWPEDAVSYFGGGKGDECHVSFHFPVMPRLFMALRMEDRFPIIDILDQTPPIPETSQWALFLRNHDELTLEMVTDEERDYMYRVYASDQKARINLGIRRRLAPLLGNDRRKIELLNLLLCSLPGTPVLYYGDEIGMGDNTFLGDRNGVRTPMHWSSDKNAGFSKASPHALFLPIILDPEYHYEAVNVEAQQGNPNSLLWWTKRLLRLRQRWLAFGRGSIVFLHPENRKVLAFIREHGAESILVVANLSRVPQPVELNLSGFEGVAPVELFGRTEFPVITDKPYLLTLSPYAAFWFALRSPTPLVSRESARTEWPLFTLDSDVRELFASPCREKFQASLPGYVRPRRWFGAKGREISSITIVDLIEMEAPDPANLLMILQVDFIQGDSNEYLLPISLAAGSEAESIVKSKPGLVIARIEFKETKSSAILYDATGSQAFGKTLFELLARRKQVKGASGHLETITTPAFRRLFPNGQSPKKIALGGAEQSNTAMTVNGKLFLKLFRRLEPGLNPDLEIGQYLSAKKFRNAPAVAGAIQYRRDADLLTLAIATEIVPESKDAWEYALDTLSRYFDRVLARPAGALPTPGSVLGLLKAPLPNNIHELIGTFLESARLLGQRTGEMHVALGTAVEDKNFAPEPFTPFYQRSLYQSMRNHAVQIFALLKKRLKSLDAPAQELASRALELENELMKRFRAVHQKPIAAMRIRIHGDYHLGQVLYTGKDFMIIDFEGEPARSLSERRIKRTPLRDVAGMIRSFHYAAHASLLQQVELGKAPSESLANVEQWTHFWYQWVSAAFFKGYMDVMDATDLLPTDETDLNILLSSLLLEKAVYEVGYELNNRPDWIRIPLQGIIQLIESGK